MTAWTSEPPREGAWYWVESTAYLPGRPKIQRVWTKDDPWDSCGERRSTHEIPSAEVLAALENLAATVRREIDAGADGNSDNIDAALRALEEARRG
jgi:hypothetical protein